MQVTPSQLKSLLDALIPKRLPVLITGAPGIGKSDIVEQAAVTTGHDLLVSYPVVEDPTDSKGLPFPAADGSAARLLPFGDLERVLRSTSPLLWSLDDLGQANTAVQAAKMQLLLARRIGDAILASPDTASISDRPAALFAIATALAAQATPSNFDRVTVYANRLIEAGRDEFAALLVIGQPERDRLQVAYGWTSASAARCRLQVRGVPDAPAGKLGRSFSLCRHTVLVHEAPHVYRQDQLLVREPDRNHSPSASSGRDRGRIGQRRTPNFRDSVASQRHRSGHDPSIAWLYNS